MKWNWTPPCFSLTFFSLVLSLSSEDELEILLNGTPDQKKKLIREYLTGESESSSGDEFEKEMEAELSCTIKTMEGSWKTSEEAGAEGGNSPLRRVYCR